VKYWEIIADNLSKAGWSWGCVAAVDSNGRTIWIADAHRDNGKRFVVRAGEKLTARPLWNSNWRFGIEVKYRRARAERRLNLSTRLNQSPNLFITGVNT
jgi:hypothetical protein